MSITFLNNKFGIVLQLILEKLRKRRYIEK